MESLSDAVNILFLVKFFSHYFQHEGIAFGVLYLLGRILRERNWSDFLVKALLSE